MIKRKLDDLGRVCLPAEMRKEIGLENGSEVNIGLEDNKIILTNPKGMKSREEIKEKIQTVDRSPKLDSDQKDYIISTLMWVLNEED